jgi:hypothetical protein
MGQLNKRSLVLAETVVAVDEESEWARMAGGEDEPQPG